jgi:hypothetical protein
MVQNNELSGSMKAGSILGSKKPYILHGEPLLTYKCKQSFHLIFKTCTSELVFINTE